MLRISLSLAQLANYFVTGPGNLFETCCPEHVHQQIRMAEAPALRTKAPKTKWSEHVSKGFKTCCSQKYFLSTWACDHGHCWEQMLVHASVIIWK